MSDIITKINIKDKGVLDDLTEVVANPELVGDEQTLNGLYVNGETYKIVNGTDYQNGNLILINNDTISVDSDKISLSKGSLNVGTLNNTLLGINNNVADNANDVIVLGRDNKIYKNPTMSPYTSTSFSILEGYNNTTSANCYLVVGIGANNTITYTSNAQVIGDGNLVGHQYSVPDSYLTAIGSNNKIGNATSKICKNIIGIGNNINNQNDYTFTIDTNGNGTYGSTRSSLEGKLDGLYYNNEKMATETYVDEHGGGGGGTTLYRHHILVKFYDDSGSSNRYCAITLNNSSQEPINSNQAFRQLFIDNGWKFEDTYYLQDITVNEVDYYYEDQEDPSTIVFTGISDTCKYNMSYNSSNDSYYSQGVAYGNYDVTLVSIESDTVSEL